MAGAGNPQAAQPAQPGIYGQSAQLFNTAAGMTQPGQFGAATAANMNPFQGMVTQRTLGDLERQRQMQMNDIGASAQAAGAFGGSRHGVAEAETNRGFADQFADTAAQMNMANFNNAQNMAMNQGQMAGNLAGQGFDMGNTITNQQMQQGTMQQAMQQALFDQAQGMFGQYAGQPGTSLQYPLAAIGGVPQPQSQTTSQKPGLFNFLSLAMGL